MMHNYIISSMDLLGFFKTSLQKKYQSKKRFFDLLLHWSTYNHFDFEEPIFQKAFLDFLEQSAFDMNEKSQIREHVIKPQKIHTVDTVPLPPGYSFNILTFNPKDIAKQITLMDHQMFKEISPNELLKKNFMNEEKSPTIKKFSERFNLITGWIGTLIVSEANVKTRRKLVCHFIVIAIELFELNNFAGLLSCFVGLTQICVSRLQLTWKGVPSNFLDKWKKIEIVCSPLGNFKNLRAIQDKCNMPLVLSPTLFIKDLTANDEIDMYINNNLLNFNKMNQIGKILKNISLAQNSPYDLEHHPVLYNLLLKINTEPADVRDKLSLFIEQVH
uniref:Ras-GEF domain-containing protein n=1 Tax=Arcella intermedia TaxID=1963864 RepID=A0A6B2L9K6_9EUKA